MNVLGIAFLAQLAAPMRQSPAVLSFPQPGLDDSASYQGYQTRFFRDAAGNTVQIYLDGRSGRVVHLLANSENESIGFTARDADGYPAALHWEGSDARVSAHPHTGARTLEHRLVADGSQIYVGSFLLGSMRVERDLQYSGRHRGKLSAAPFPIVEIDRMLAALERLDPVEQRRHLTMLNAPDLRRLRARLEPRITTFKSDSSWVTRVMQLSLDGRDSLALELRVNARWIVGTRTGDSVFFRARSGSSVPIVVRITTSGKPLTPLTRKEIFNPEFLAFLARTADTAGLHGRWLERQTRGVELLASGEKLMAGLPAYATYFGRDMLVSALMMRPIWRDEMSAFAIASVLRRLSPLGQVSHEEALGGQAVREATAEYATLIDLHFRASRVGNRTAADGLLSRARAVLRDHRRTRENYHMIDDEFQFPVLVARWLSDRDVSAERKREFLLDTSDGGGSRLERLLRELALVTRMTSAYAADPIATNLVSFPPRDSGWSSASWRDSGVGYGGGRFAMDVNAIWAPHALEGIAQIFDALRTIGISVDSMSYTVPELRADTPLGTYARDPGRLRSAIATWWGASRHFLVRLGPDDVRSRVTARLQAMSEQDRSYWTSVLAATRADQDSLVFLALSLDGAGRPIGIANTDPATRLFLGDAEGGAAADMTPESVLRDVRLFVRAFPVGLFVDRVGPVVANDAYAPPSVWSAFDRDRYHGPRVVWGREVNLFLLGVAGRIATTSDPAYARELREAMTRVRAAVEISGFRSELWSYEVTEGQVKPIRYGSGSDIQLWSTTDLVVQFMLSRLR